MTTNYSSFIVKLDVAARLDHFLLNFLSAKRRNQNNKMLGNSN